MLLTGSSTVAELLRLRALVAGAGLPFVGHHTSGHAPLADLKRLVDAVKPQRIVPIHTEGAQEYTRDFAGVTPQEDLSWWTV